MSHLTSGPLEFNSVKGLHRVWATWWIDTGLAGYVFKLKGPSKALIASMSNQGRLTVQPGYLWDGSSGPTIDGEADPVPSLVHDVLYEAIRAGSLPMMIRPETDGLYYELLRERGMGVVFSRPSKWWKPWELFRGAGTRWLGLRLFARYAASRKPEYPRRTAA